MAPVLQDPTDAPIGAEQELARLALQAQRLRRCVDALEQRVAELRGTGTAVPAALGLALNGFHADLHAIHDQLVELAR
jgi:hypothetical protein